VLFKTQMSECGDYLTNRGRLNLNEFCKLMERLSKFEVLALSNREEEIKRVLQ
jgi:5'-3' exonuclease